MDLAPGHFRQSCPKWTSPRITFAKVARNGPRPGSLSPKLPEMDLAPDHFRQSYPKWTSPRVAFAKAARNGPRPGSLSPKLPQMDLAPDHFRQSYPKWASAPDHFRQSCPKWASAPAAGGESRKIRERGCASNFYFVVFDSFKTACSCCSLSSVLVHWR